MSRPEIDSPGKKLPQLHSDAERDAIRWCRPARIVGIVARHGLGRGAYVDEEVHDHVVMAVSQALDDVEESNDGAHEPRLFGELADHRFRQALAEEDAPARQSPPPLRRLVAASDEQYAPLVDDDGRYGDLRVPGH